MGRGVAVERSRPSPRGGSRRVLLGQLPLGPGRPQIPLLRAPSPSPSWPFSLRSVDIYVSEFREDGTFLLTIAFLLFRMMLGIFAQ